MLTKSQLEMRKTGLGGSDIAAALGLSPWKTQLQLWAEKTGQIETKPQSEAMEWGSRLETPILMKFDEDHPELRVSHAGGTVRDQEHPHLLATPDGFIVDQSGRMGILEVKTSSQRPWDEVPLYYLLQVQHYMNVLGRDFAWFGVLFQGTHYREYGPIHIDREDYEKNIRPRLDEFWSAVESNDPVFEPTSLHDLSLKVPLDSEMEPVVAGLDMLAAHEEYKRCKAHMDEWKEAMDEARLDLAERMGAATKVVSADGKTLATQADIDGRVMIDAKKLLAEMPDVYESYMTKGKSHRRMRVY